jgi:glycosyltransferase involved in cell wall biosynthesis
MLSRLVTEAAASRGFQHDVVSLTELGVHGPVLQGAGVPVRALQLTGFAGLLPAVIRLRRHIRETRPDVIQSWLYHADFVALLAAALARRGPPVVWNLRCSDMDLTRYAWTTRALLRILARLSRYPRAVIANSYAGRDWHAKAGYRPRQWHVIPNGFDTNTLAPDPGARAQARARFQSKEDSPVFVCSARLDPMKDHGTLLDAFAILLRRHPDAKLLLLGKGTDSTDVPLARLRQGDELAGAVIGLGERTQDHAEVMQAADALVLSSAFGEGFPNVLGEAMCLGIPCITTDCGDAARIVDGTGWAVPRRDPSAIASAMQELAEMTPDRRQALGSAARAKMIAEFSLERVSSAYACFYRGLLPTRS